MGDKNENKSKPEYLGEELVAQREFLESELNIGTVEAQSMCASLVYVSLRGYQAWERNERKIQPAFFELLSLKLSKLKRRSVSDLPDENQMVVIKAIDNSMGDHDMYHAFASINDKGVWIAEESGRPIIEYAGDKIIEWWPLTDESSKKID